MKSMKPMIIKRIFLIVLSVILFLFLSVVITAATSLAGGDIDVISIMLTVFFIIIEVLCVGLLVFFGVIFFQQRELVWKKMDIFKEMPKDLDDDKDKVINK